MIGEKITIEQWLKDKNLSKNEYHRQSKLISASIEWCVDFFSLEE